MLDLDQYMDNSIEVKINGSVVNVKQPTVAIVEKVDKLRAEAKDADAAEIWRKCAVLFMNNNKEGVQFKEEDVMDWTQEAITRVIVAFSTMRYEADHDPNSESQSQTGK